MPLLTRRGRRTTHYPWTRYWLPRGGNIDAEDGFLQEPGTDRYLREVNQHLRTLDELDQYACLLLQGDPGLGKSYELEDYVVRLTQAQTGSGARATPYPVLAHDITEFDNRDEIRRTLFQSDKLSEWTHSDGLLYLVIDSLDEAIVDFDSLCSSLLDELAPLPLDRLRLRIACRTSELPASFQEGLARLFSDALDAKNLRPNPDTSTVPSGAPGRRPFDLGMFSAALESILSHRESADRTAEETNESKAAPVVRPFANVEITVLTRRAAHLAAVARFGTDAKAEEFLAAVDAASAQQFAARPQTLTELLERYSNGDTLTGDQFALYQDMCQRLAGSRRVRSGQSHPSLRTSPTDRYRLARRVCAAMLIGNRRSLFLGDGIARSDGVLELSSIAGEELLGGEQIRAHESELLEAINTGLFTAVGDRGLSAHQTLAEFLTADWLVAHELPLTKLLSLVTDPADSDRHIVPQLRHVTAWIAARREDVFEVVSVSDPDLLLWNDVVQIPVHVRPALVDALLLAVRQRRLPNLPFGHRRALRRLAHDELAAQLAPVLDDENAPPDVREMAIDIARACHCAGLSRAATDLALRTTEPEDLRGDAAYLVADVGDGPDRARLVPLATSNLPDDLADQLKGAALSACWSLLSPDALFGALAQIRRPNFAGYYALVLGELARSLDITYLAAGARWLAETNSHGIYFERIARRLFELAMLEEIQGLDPTVLPNLGAYVRTQSASHEQVLGDKYLLRGEPETDPLVALLRSSPSVRRALLTAIADAPGEPHFYGLSDSVPGLVTAEDVPWSIAYLAEMPAGDARRASWIELIQLTFDAGVREHLAAAFAHREDPDVTAAAYHLPANHSTIDGAVAEVSAQRARRTAQQALRARGRDRREAERVAAAAAAVLGPLGSRLRRSLMHHGDIAARWSRATHQVLSGADGTFHWHFTKETLTELNALGARDFSSDLVDVAIQYLCEVPIPAVLFPERSTRNEVHYAFTAAVTLRLLSPDRFHRVAPACLTRWTDAIVGRQCFGLEEPLQAALLQRIGELAPGPTSAALLVALKPRMLGRSEWVSESLLRIGLAFDDFRTDLLSDIAIGRFSESRTHHLLNEVLKADIVEATEVAIRLFRSRKRSSADRERSLVAGSVLLLRAPGKAWTVLFQYLSKSDAGARALLRRAAVDREGLSATVLAQLADEQIADLHLLLARLYPPKTDPWHVGTYSPGPSDHLPRWRDQLIRALQARRTDSAVEQLERIARLRPDADWLARVSVEARAALRGDRWRGIEPRELVQLIDRNELRIVESGAALLQLLQDSLIRFQQELTGELRSVVGLWNESKSGNTPKLEEHFANTIARHFRHDLRDRQIIIGRELILQVGVLGGASGDRTDIDVLATERVGSNRTIQQVRAVVEVKGSWNSSVRTAMKAQLVDQYLEPHRIRAGMLVVGQFASNSWPMNEQHKRSLRLGTVDELQRELDLQAASLTTSMREVRAFVVNASLP